MGTGSCTNCGRPLEVTAGKCRNCGANAPTAAAPPPPRVSGAPSREVTLEVADDGADKLELDLGSAPASLRPRFEAPASLRPVQVASAAPIERGPPKPIIDPMEARLLAKFGPPPEKLWETPAYRRNVRARLAELEPQFKAREKRWNELSRELEDALVGLAQRGVASTRVFTRGERAAYVHTLERLQLRERELAAVDGAASAATEEARRKLTLVDQRVEEVHRENRALRAEEERLAEDPKAAGPKLEETRKKIEEIRATLDVARKERAAIEAEIKAIPQRNDPATDKARADYRAVCADFAQFVIDDPVHFGEEFNEARERIRKLREVAGHVEREYLLYKAATEAFDPDAFASGAKVVYAAIAAGAVLLLAIVALVVTR
jgi:hypothetical protein